MAYSGDPILAEDLLFRPEHSIIDQSLHSRMGATTTNGDGFGIGWYGEGAEPAVFKSIDPAWNDMNLREIAGRIRTPLLFAHIRASTGTPVQRSNCHPFRHGQWLWMHNGAIRGFHEIKRDLLMAVDPSLYPDIEGSTDSETLFFLALTFGLTDDPFTAVARAVGLVEKVGREHGVELPDPDDRGDQRRRVRLGLPLLQRRTESVAVLLHRCRRRYVSCTPKWRCCADWATKPGWWSPNLSVISRARGTKCPSPRPEWSVPARTRSGHFSRWHRRKLARSSNYCGAGWINEAPQKVRK